jgi:hypothetical protein
MSNGYFKYSANKKIDALVEIFLEMASIDETPYTGEEARQRLMNISSAIGEGLSADEVFNLFLLTEEKALFKLHTMSCLALIQEDDFKKSGLKRSLPVSLIEGAKEKNRLHLSKARKKASDAGGRATVEIYKPTEDAARKDWESWEGLGNRGGQARYIVAMCAKHRVDERTVKGWLKKWKGERAYCLHHKS